jgi:hypothetical protein
LKKILHKKRAGGVAQCAGPEFKPEYCQKKKEKKKKQEIKKEVESKAKSWPGRVSPGRGRRERKVRWCERSPISLGHVNITFRITRGILWHDRDKSSIIEVCFKRF